MPALPSKQPLPKNSCLHRLLFIVALCFFPGFETAWAQPLAPQASRQQNDEEAAALNRAGMADYSAGHYASAIDKLSRALQIQEAVLGSEHPTIAQSLNNLAVLLVTTGRYTEAEPLYRRALAIYEQADGKEHPSVATALNNLAELLWNTGRYAEAELLYRRALAIYEQAHGKEHPDVGVALNNLALLLQTTGRYADAEPFYRRALVIYEQAHDKEHPLVATALNNLALLLNTTGRYAEAEPLYRRALAIDEQAYGPEHPAVATDLNNLALLLQATGRYADAEPFYRRALVIYEQAHDKEHPDVAMALHNLASLLQTTGRYSDAEPLYRQALAIYEKVHGKEHPDVATALNNLALLLNTTGRYAEAEPLYRRALAINEQAYGPEHPAVATDLNNLALLLQATGRYAEAEPFYRRALVIYEQAHGKEHPSVAGALSNLAEQLRTTGRYAEAEPLYRRALVIYEQAHGKEHPDVATALNNLAQLLRTTGRYPEAEPLYRRALAIFEQAHGKEHPAVATDLNNLALLLQATGRYAEAEPLYRRALVIYEQAHGKEHPDVAIALNNLAALLSTTGRYTEAEPLYRRALVIRDKTLGPEHPNIATTLGNLAMLLDATGRHSEVRPLLLRAYQIAVTTSEPELRRNAQGSLMHYYRQSDPRLAIFFGKQAVNTLQSLRAGLAVGSAETLAAYTGAVSETYHDLANLLIDQGRLPEAEQVLALLKEQEYFDFVRRDAEVDPFSQPVSLTQVESEWDTRVEPITGQLVALGREAAEIARIDEQVRTPQQVARLAELESQLDAGRAQVLAFMEELQAAFAQLSAERLIAFSAQQLDSLEGIQPFLGEAAGRAVLVHYLPTPERLRILVTTPEVQVNRDSAVSETELNRLITEYRAVLQNPTRDPLPLAHKLYKVLIEPIAADLKQAQSATLMVSLDGTLRYLPIAALHSGERWLAEDYALAVYTAATRHNIAEKPVPEWRVAGLGVSEGGTVGGRAFAPLPAVPLELASIIQSQTQRPAPSQPTAPSVSAPPGVLPGIRHLDSAFSTAAFKESIRQQYPVLHLATHFHFEPGGNDTQSYLLLGNGEALTLAEFRSASSYKMKVDLLTLSACETALGSSGEGGSARADGREVEGLGTLAQKRGAKAVLATLWSVADASTGIFMKTLYAERQQNQLTKAQALRQAQLAFIDGRATAAGIPEQLRGARREGAQLAQADYRFDPTKPFAHPYYWAPFVLMGNWL